MLFIIMVCLTVGLAHSQWHSGTVSEAEHMKTELSALNLTDMVIAIIRNPRFNFQSGGNCLEIHAYYNDIQKGVGK
jgi:hypothetical protein